MIGGKVLNILVTTGWAIALASLAVKAERSISAWTTFSTVDLLLALIISILAGIMIVDLKTILYGYFGSMISSFIMAVLFSFLLDWFVAGLQEVMFEIPFGWEFVIYEAMRRIFRIFFPTALFFCFLGVFLGGFLGETAGLREKLLGKMNRG